MRSSREKNELDLNYLVEKGILVSRRSGVRIQFLSAGDIEKKLK